MAAYKGVIVLASIWLSVVYIHQVTGSEVPHHEHGETQTQENIPSGYTREEEEEEETKLRPNTHRGMYPGLRLQSNRSFGNAHLTEDSDIIQHWAIYKSKPNDKWSYYGAEATLAVYSYPYLKADRSTAGLIGVLYGQRGPRDQFNAILVGWTVDPKFYGDSLARFFISWTADADRKTGCFDLRCEGFRSLNGAVITPGDVVDPLSTGKGNQSDITFRIFKDQISGDWWLYYGQYDNLSPVGYFPKTLFGGLADRADQIYFGGHVSFLKGGVSPPMGNGHSLGDGPAYFKGVQYVGQNGQKYLPDELRDYVDNKDCYQVSYFVYDTFHYGGPGGCTN